MSLATRPWNTKPPKAEQRHEIDPVLRQLVRERAGGCCECCGLPLGAKWDAHHRKLRARGGQDSAANLLALCRDCHRRIHGHVKWATDEGFIVSAYDDPVLVPVSVHCDSRRLLTYDGFYKLLPSPPPNAPNEKER